MRDTTIYAAILSEHGNTDEQYPRPLTCGECGLRPQYISLPMPHITGWYVTEADPLPEGWQVIEDQNYRHRMTYCPSCYADRAEPREEEEIGY